ncbi:MAG: 4-hydroxy-tetrahydrodipicolinate synthase [Calothrix sp. SM1_5_4]|nr:4-hydroxy-tetrahydrodipicolinate synthase [Calothrix sp. SM1_5_4]
MSWPRRILIFSFAAAGMLGACACGVKGDPLPPERPLNSDAGAPRISVPPRRSRLNRSMNGKMSGKTRMMKTRAKFDGIITALVTPFKDGAVDMRSFKRLLRSQLDQGVQGFVINGTTAESPTLEWDEVERLFAAAREEAGEGFPLIVGTGSNSTAHACAMTEAAAKMGADAVLVVVPYYNKPPQRGLKKHFSEIARRSRLPVILYNVPSRTIASLEPATAAELSREVNIVGIKDATGDMTVCERLKAECAEGFTLLSGDDGTCMEFMARGGHGVISVSSHLIGREMLEFQRRLREGDRSVTAEYAERTGALMKSLYIEANPIPVKMALHWMGLLDSPELRSPLVELDSQYHKDFKACLERLGKI